MRIFSRKKYVFDVFRLSKKAAVHVLQASRKHEKKNRFGVWARRPDSVSMARIWTRPVEFIFVLLQW